MNKANNEDKAFFMEFEKNLSINKTNIPGLLIVNLPVHGDERGWFKENYQREKMLELGLPDFKIVQNNISFNAQRGTTRGIHAEPWDKFVSLASGSVFGAWVDLREGDTFGEVFTCVLDPSKAIFVPRGVGNSFQALENDTVYTYLVNNYWSPESKRYYTFVNLYDPDLDIKWPIPIEEATLSIDDMNHPYLSEIDPMLAKKALIIGANGQLGKSLQTLYAEEGHYFDCVDKDTFDISNFSDYQKIDWNAYDTVINACAFTSVDIAETDAGRIAAWKANATGPALLSKMAIRYDFTLVHISSDYVFDGKIDNHDIDEPFSPLSVYGQTKAAGDLAVSVVPRHYIVRTSWAIGDGKNFVKTMAELSDKCANPEDVLKSINVVNDQYGRLCFTDDLARFIYALIDHNESYGTYNFTNPGHIASWYEIAKKVFGLRNKNENCVRPVTTTSYIADSDKLVADRPVNSTLVLEESLIEELAVQDWETELFEYIKTLELC